MTTYFITICAHMQQNLFQRDEVAKLMLATFFRYRDAGEFDLHEYVVMPNHLHLLLSINDAQKLSRVIQLIKGGFSHPLRENGIVFRAVCSLYRVFRDAGAAGLKVGSTTLRAS